MVLGVRGHHAALMRVRVHVDLPVERAAQIAVGEHAEHAVAARRPPPSCRAPCASSPSGPRSAAHPARRAATPRRCASGPRRAAAAGGRARRRDASGRNPARVKPRASSTATASASPMASVAVVLAVGREVERAGLLGNGDVERPRPPRARASSRACRSWRSAARPGASDAAAACTISGGLAGVRQGEHRVVARDHAEVAVARLRRVQEEGRACRCWRASRRSCRAMWPDLPMPVTTTRPRHYRQMRHACTNAPPSCGVSASTARARPLAHAVRRPAAARRWPTLERPGRPVQIDEVIIGVRASRAACREHVNLRAMNPLKKSRASSSAGLPGAARQVASRGQHAFRGARSSRASSRGLRAVQRHQLVYAHARRAQWAARSTRSSIEALTPEEYASQASPARG